MGGSMNDESSSFYTWHGRRLSKHVHDNVHGNIYLDPLSLKFIDTEQFQRLRDLKQLGLVHLVYPGAVHSRFEHSLGVYWLAGAAVNTIKAHQGSELEIDHSDIQTVKLAGLLHDVGHGPFSHLFEHKFLPQVLNGSRWSHEDMSLKMIDYIVDEHNIEIDSENLKKVKVKLFGHLLLFPAYFFPYIRKCSEAPFLGPLESSIMSDNDATFQNFLQHAELLMVGACSPQSNCFSLPLFGMVSFIPPSVHSPSTPTACLE